MAVNPDLGLYPHSAPDGTPIPFDILRPAGLILQAFTNVAVNNIVIPSTAEVLVIQTTADCILRFGADVSVPANGVNLSNAVFLTPGFVWSIDHNAATKFGVIRAGAANGTIYVQLATRWKDLRKVQQFNRM